MVLKKNLHEEREESRLWGLGSCGHLETAMTGRTTMMPVWGTTVGPLSAGGSWGTATQFAAGEREVKGHLERNPASVN